MFHICSPRSSVIGSLSPRAARRVEHGDGIHPDTNQAPLPRRAAVLARRLNLRVNQGLHLELQRTRAVWSSGHATVYHVSTLLLL
jgi:hypothetical protein